MTIGTLFFIVLIIACPVGMILMMRGGHIMGGSGHTMGGDQSADTAARDGHIAHLEQENARLRGAAPKAEVAELIGPRR